MELPYGVGEYRLIPNGTIETSFESGIITYHYYIFPSGYNERLNSLCPLIPKNEAASKPLAGAL